MLVRNVLCFDRAGRQNAGAAVEAVRDRRAQLGIEHVVVASHSGTTALAFWEGAGAPGIPHASNA